MISPGTRPEGKQVAVGFRKWERAETAYRRGAEGWGRQDRGQEDGGKRMGVQEDRGQDRG